MVKRIQIEELTPGMFIVDVASTWSTLLNTERKQFVKDEQFIRLLKQNGIDYVFIDPTKKIDKKLPAPTIIKSIGTEAEIKVEVKQSLGIQAQARKIVSKMISDFQKGKDLEIDEAENAVEKVTGSILHNKYVLAGLSTMKQKNVYLYEHALSSSVLMVSFAHTIGFDENKQRELGLGAMLYDLGMLNVPSYIQNLPGKYSKQQYDLMKRHVEFGYTILKNHSQVTENILRMASEHHERLDGSGYPFGLKDAEISKVARMTAIVDVYDASTSDRGYKKGMLPSVALSKLYQNGGVQFDKELVNLFIKSVGIYPFGTLVRLENGLIGIVIKIDPEQLINPHLRIIFNPKKGGMVSPYNINLLDFHDYPEYKIKQVVPKEKLRLRYEEILRIIGVA